MRSPVRASSATRYAPTTASTRASPVSASSQYATPRVCRTRWNGSPLRPGGSSNQSTSPVFASSAATVPRPLLM